MSSILPDDRLRALLVEHQLIDAATWDQVMADAKQLNLPPLDILFGRRLLDRDYFMNLLSQELGVERINLKRLEIPAAVLQLIPEKIALERQVIPFAADAQVVKLAMVNPQDLETISLVANLTSHRVEPYLAAREELQYALTRYQQLYQQRYQERIAKEFSQTGAGVEDEDLTATRIVENLLGYAMGMNASDLHIEAGETSGIVRFRVDGVLREVMKVPKTLHPALIAKIKVLAGLQLDEHFRPQDGRIKTKLGEFLFDIRVSIMPTLYGEKAVLRLLAGSSRPISTDELGVSEQIREMLERAIQKSYGMLLITGPTGSGKTTTLYTLLQRLNRPEVNICTIEDPIEYELPRVNQTQINPKVDLTFAAGLRAFLRQDPDVIMVGEIRDFETLDISIQAALTGHLLLSTLHTNDAPSAIPRMLDLGAPSYLMAATLNVILAQRLTRRICLDCIYSEPLGPVQREIILRELRAAGLNDKELRTVQLPEYLYKGKGCQLCGSSGYRGRIGIYEGIEVDDEVRTRLGHPNFDLTDFKQWLRNDKKFQSMFEDGIEKVGLGITTLEEVLRVIKE